MSDRRIFVNEHVHTDQIREAGSELAFQDLRIIDSLSARVEDVNPAIEPHHSETLVNLALGVHNIPEDLKNKWRRAERWVTWLMAQAGYLHSPEMFDRKLTEFLEPVDQIKSPTEAMGFLNFSKLRLIHLLETGSSGRTDVWITRVRAENLVLKRASRDSVFMTRPIRPTIN